MQAEHWALIATENQCCQWPMRVTHIWHAGVNEDADWAMIILTETAIASSTSSSTTKAIAFTTAIATTKAFASASCCLLTQADTVLLLPLPPP